MYVSYGLDSFFVTAAYEGKVQFSCGKPLFLWSTFIDFYRSRGYSLFVALLCKN